MSFDKICANKSASRKSPKVVEQTYYRDGVRRVGIFLHGVRQVGIFLHSTIITSELFFTVSKL